MFKLWKMKISNKIKKSINIKLSLWILISLIISVMFGTGVAQIFEATHLLDVKHVDYDKERNDTVIEVLNFINGLYKEENNKDKYIKKNIASFKECTIYIVNKNGDVEYQGVDDRAECIYIDGFINDMEETNDNLIKILYPLSIDNNIHYLVYTKFMRGVPIYTHEIGYVVAAILSLILWLNTKNCA